MGAAFLAYCLSVAQKCRCVISLDVKQPQFCQFDVMSSMEGTKAGSVCLHFEGVCCEWAGEGSRDGRGLKFPLVLHFLTKLQWEFFLLLLDASAFVSWSLTLTSSQPVGYERRRWVPKSDKCSRYRSVASLTVSGCHCPLLQPGCSMGWWLLVCWGTWNASSKCFVCQNCH